MSSVSLWILAQQYMTRYGMTTYLLLGNIGQLCNIIFFSHHVLRRKPFSLYIFTASICGFIGLNISVIPLIYAVDHTNSFTTSLTYCRVQSYFRHVFNQLMRTFVVIACADRYAICSDQGRIKAINQYRIALRIVPSVALFWLIIGILPTMLYSIEKGQCDVSSDVNAIVYCIYTTIVVGIFPLTGMITFGCLIRIKLKRIRVRIQPIRLNDLPVHVLRQRDRDMIKMLLFEITGYICTTIPFTFITIYKPITDEEMKTLCLSFNQPKFCPNATWYPNGTIFANASTYPYGLFVDNNNTVYTTEQITNRVQIWSSSGGSPMTTFSGSLINPGAIFVTMNGDIYVDNGNNYRVEKWTSNAVNGTAVMNTSAQCLGLFIDANDILYCSASNAQKVIAQSLANNTNSMVWTVAGTGIAGSASDQLSHPNGIFIDQNFSLYVADYENNRIQKFQAGQLNGETVVGSNASIGYSLSGPVAVILDADSYIFIVDKKNNRIVGSGPNGFRCLVGCSQVAGSLVTQLNGPRHFGFDTYGNLFIADRQNSRIMQFTLQSNVCAQSIASTTLQVTVQMVVTINTTSITTNSYRTSPTIISSLALNTTKRYVRNGVGKTNSMSTHVIVWPIVIIFGASFYL